MIERHNCAGEVWDGHWHMRGCQNNGKLFEDDKWWCSTHAPSKRVAREEILKAKRARENEKERDHLRYKAAMYDVCNGVSTEELEQLGNGGLKRLLKLGDTTK